MGYPHYSGDCAEHHNLVADGTAAGVLAEVLAERVRQDEKWGEQNHPDLSPQLASHGLAAVFAHYGLPFPADVKAYVDEGAQRGESNFVGIALEEFTEIVEAAALGDEDAVHTEVVQLAAVCTQWAQAIDRRKAATS